MDRKFPYLDEDVVFPFPSVHEATEEGIVASGGNLSPGMLLSAYSQGVFPWYSNKEPILWWSPDPRFVLFPEKLHVSSTMKKILRQGRFRITLDTCFSEVISHCSSVRREGQRGTWITRDMRAAYEEMHARGFAHSAEAWLGDRLAGGLYGISLGRIFFGESMFSLVPNASKAAFIELVWYLQDRGITLIDSQVYTPHLASLGAEEIPRQAYLSLLRDCLSPSSLRGNWANGFPDFPRSTRFLDLVGKQLRE